MIKERFSGLKFKIHGLKSPVLDKYPELLRYKSIADVKDIDGLDEILRYLIYLYDPNTDLNQECPDLKDRKTEACSLAGLNGDDFQKICDMGEPFISLITCLLCEVYHNRKNMEWHTTQQELLDFTRLRWSKVDAATLSVKQRSDLSKFCDEANKKMDILEEEIFGDHEDVKVKVTVDRWYSPEKFAAPTLKLVNA